MENQLLQDKKEAAKATLEELLEQHGESPEALEAEGFKALL